MGKKSILTLLFFSFVLIQGYCNQIPTQSVSLNFISHEYQNSFSNPENLTQFARSENRSSSKYLRYSKGMMGLGIGGIVVTVAGLGATVGGAVLFVYYYNSMWNSAYSGSLSGVYNSSTFLYLGAALMSLGMTFLIFGIAMMAVGFSLSAAFRKKAAVSFEIINDSQNFETGLAIKYSF